MKGICTSTREPKTELERVRFNWIVKLCSGLTNATHLDKKVKKFTSNMICYFNALSLKPPKSYSKVSSKGTIYNKESLGKKF